MPSYVITLSTLSPTSRTMCTTSARGPYLDEVAGLDGVDIHDVASATVSRGGYIHVPHSNDVASFAA